MTAKFRMKVSICIFYFIAATIALNAQVSLLPEHIISIDEITLIRDCRNENRWYYLPQKPVLLEKEPGNSENPRPAFQLLTYQSEQDKSLYEGAMLQFSVSLKLNEEQKNKILKVLKRKAGSKNAAKISLAPLPFKLAEASLYNADGDFLTRKSQSPGLAPAYLTGALPFQMQLNKFEADLYSALVDGQNSGVGVLLTLSFEGMLPAAGFKVTVNWDQTYELLSKSDDLKIAFNTFFSGIEAGVSKQKIRESLISNKCIKVESLTNEKVTDEIIDRYLDPILVRIQQELIEKIESPHKIKLSERNSDAAMEKCFFPFRVQSQTVLKSRKMVRKGSETIELNHSAIVARKTSCGSFIGINKYSDQVKDDLVRTMPLNSWASAYLMLPDVDDSPELRLNSVSMTANVVDKKGEQVADLSETASWSSAKPGFWLNKDGKPTGNLNFPLMALFKKHDNDIKKVRDEYRFKVDVNIMQKLKDYNSLKITYYSPLFNGDLPLAQPVDLVDHVIFDASALTFGRQDLLKVRINLTCGKNKLEHIFSYTNDDDRSIIFIVRAALQDNKAEPIIPRVEFDAKSLRGKPWQYNGEDLRELDQSLYFMLFDSDWKNGEDSED